MAHEALPHGFGSSPSDWWPWPGLAAEVEPLLPFRPAAPAAAPAGARGAGLVQGEWSLAAAAAARHIGCAHLTATEAAAAAEGLKRRREVQVLLEEGIPSPLTGRLGAIITAAGALTRSPPVLTRAEIWRLEEEKLDDQEIVDLILAAALASQAAGLTLGLGRPAPR